MAAASEAPASEAAAVPDVECLLDTIRRRLGEIERVVDGIIAGVTANARHDAHRLIAYERSGSTFEGPASDVLRQRIRSPVASRDWIAMGIVWRLDPKSGNRKFRRELCATRCFRGLGFRHFGRQRPNPACRVRVDLRGNDWAGRLDMPVEEFLRIASAAAMAECAVAACLSRQWNANIRSVSVGC